MPREHPWKRMSLLPALAFAVVAGTAEAQWTQQSSGTLHDLEEIRFPAPDTGYAVGDSGTVVRTVDGGAAWTLSPSGTVADLHDLWFIDAVTGFAAGDSGILLSTTDGGATWSQQVLAAPGPVDLYAVCFLNADTGFAGGRVNVNQGILFKTTDGGQSWTIANTPTAVLDVRYVRIAFPAPQTGYALTRGMCMKTTDGGDNWFITDTALVNAGGMFSILEDCFFFSEDTGYVVGWYNPFTGYTVDGGAAWTDLALGQWVAVDFPDPLTGYLAGWGTMQRTTDGGMTWTDITTPVLQGTDIRSMAFTGAQTGYVCGGGGAILKTTVGGVSTANEHLSNPAWRLFPNPSEGTVHISVSGDLAGDGLLVVHDLYGRECFRTKMRLSPGIHRQAFSLATAGVYFVEWQSSARRARSRLVIY